MLLAKAVRAAGNSSLGCGQQQLGLLATAVRATGNSSKTYWQQQFRLLATAVRATAPYRCSDGPYAMHKVLGKGDDRHPCHETV